jgi:hypothetical protein
MFVNSSVCRRRGIDCPWASILPANGGGMSPMKMPPNQVADHSRVAARLTAIKAHAVRLRQATGCALFGSRRMTAASPVNLSTAGAKSPTNKECALKP